MLTVFNNKRRFFMWYEFLIDNYKISSFYKKIPELNNISIINIIFENNGTNISIDFQMPYLPRHW